ncbi:MAG: GNAT family N-acetyltransferase [Saprospiraceae bacterium]
MTTAYRQFCKANPHLPIFAQDWYLDAVCAGGEWGAATVEEGGQTVAALPYFLKQKGPFRYIAMPPFVKHLGPYLRQADAPYSLTETHRLYDALIEQLPAVDAFEQDFSPIVTNWLPFYWKGYQQSTRYTYRLVLDDLDRIYDGINRNMQRNIRKAQAAVAVTRDGDITDLYRINRLSFDRQALQLPYPFELLKSHDEALLAHNARALFFARDDAGRLHSASCLIHDAETAYYHIAGDDPETRNSGAGILLTWEAIRYTKEVLGLHHFDFEGSMMQNVEAIRRQFGAVQLPYFRVWKTHSRVLRWGRAVGKI